MTDLVLPADVSIQQLLDDMKGLRTFMAGSSVAALCSNRPYCYNDIDLFTPNTAMYYVTVQRLLDMGYEFVDKKFHKVWLRHKHYGTNGWHTNSMKLIAPMGYEVNVIYKRVDGHEITRLSQVLESFDFGLLGVGIETETGNKYDMRSYFFPDKAATAHEHNWDIPLPLLPYREEGLSQGYMSEYIMLRTPGRYARYAHTYGYDLSLVKPVLVEGYVNYASYKLDRSKKEDLTLGRIAEAIARHIEDDEFLELVKFEKSLPVSDGLDQIMAGLE